MERQPLRRHTPEEAQQMDEDLRRMSNDPDYQAEAAQIDAELELSDWEALKMGEKALKNAQRPNITAPKR